MLELIVMGLAVWLVVSALGASEPWGWAKFKAEKRLRMITPRLNTLRWEIENRAPITPDGLKKKPVPSLSVEAVRDREREFRRLKWRQNWQWLVAFKLLSCTLCQSFWVSLMVYLLACGTLHPIRIMAVAAIATLINIKLSPTGSCSSGKCPNRKGK